MNQLPDKLQQHTTVSNAMGYFHPSQQDVFTWQGPITLYQTQQAQQLSTQLPLVTTELNRQLRGKGFQVVNNAYNPNYLLQAAVVYGNELHDENLREIYGVEARLGSDLDNYQRGSLFLVINKPGGRPVWRGAVQIFAEPSLPLAVRQQRIQHAILSMLSNLPQATSHP